MARGTLEGVAKLTAQLNELGKLDDGKALRAAVRNGIKPAFERWQQAVPRGKVPHRTYRGVYVAGGFAETQLRRATTINASKTVASAILTTTKEAFYLLQFVELGTRYVQARPFLRDSFTEQRGAMEEKLRSTLKAAVERAVKQGAK